MPNGHHALLAARFRELHRRRAALIARRDELRCPLPDWALLPLQEAGLTAAEITVAGGSPEASARRAELARVEAELGQLEQRLAEIEQRLTLLPAREIDAIAAMLRLAIEQLQEGAGAATGTALKLLQRAAGELDGMADEAQGLRAVG